MTASSSAFLLLPPEIIANILTFLSPRSLAKLGCTCRLLQSHCENDLLWAQLVQENVPAKLESPYPAVTWRDLYLAHYPYWFLARHKIWFSDRAIGGHTMSGSIIITLYDPRRGCIEGYRLVAEHGTHTFQSWSWNSAVIIHTFNPRVKLWLDDPVIKLDLGRPKVIDFRKEMMMQTGPSGLGSAISLCQPIPEALQHRSMALWPPSILPARHRVRSESSSKFRDIGHKPRTFEEASDQTFRLRRWAVGRAGTYFASAFGDNVMTFSTLPEESYASTKDKPWQGIWVGDYSGHGCEFLLVLQKDVDPCDKTITPWDKTITPTTWTMEAPELSDTSSDDNDDDDDDEFDTDSTQDQGPDEASSPPAQAYGQPLSNVPSVDEADFCEDPSCKGRLEAIKLTGDPNVPRGEYTWIAQDIGPKGLVRVADEKIFEGARVVRSLGHCAGDGFRHGMAANLETWEPFADDLIDRYVASQLIMVSHDTLAQYWEDLGHISFYKRVNLDDFLHI